MKTKMLSLHNKYSSQIQDSPEYYKTPHIFIDKSELIDVLRDLRDNYGFDFLSDVFASHHPKQTNAEFRLYYNLYNMQTNDRLFVCLTLSQTDLQVPTITELYRAANWLERETYDFYGIDFQGHPDLRRILNMYEMTDFPLRKEFPLEDPTREDKEDKYFGR